MPPVPVSVKRLVDALGPLPDDHKALLDGSKKPKCGFCQNAECGVRTHAVAHVYLKHTPGEGGGRVERRRGLNQASIFQFLRFISGNAP
jgi:hypothetical protein